MAEEIHGQKFIERGSHAGKGIAVFTSGGDSQVINCCKYWFSSKFCVNVGYECSCEGCCSCGNLSRMQGLFHQGGVSRYD